MMFDPQANSNTQDPVPKLSAVQIRNQQATKDNNDDYQAILKYLAESLQQENMKPLKFFQEADRSFNKVLRVDELKDHVKT